MKNESITLTSLTSSEFQNLKFVAKNNFFVLHTKKDQGTDLSQKKIGFRLSKKHLKNATDRNYCKRIVREFLRNNKVSCIYVVISSRLKLPMTQRKEFCKEKIHSLLNKILVN